MAQVDLNEDEAMILLTLFENYATQNNVRDTRYFKLHQKLNNVIQRERRKKS